MSANFDTIMRLDELGLLRGSLRKRVEAKMATDAEYAYFYARNVLQAPFPAAERNIAEGGNWDYMYADGVLEEDDPHTWADRYLSRYQDEEGD